MGSNTTKLRPEVLSDLTETTAFTPNEIRAYYKAFHTGCDHNKMTVNVERFKTLYKDIFPEGDSTKFAEQVFRNFDKDNSGEVDFHEFILSVSVQQKGLPSDKLRFLFNMVDLDGTGFISMPELITLIEALRNLRQSGKAVPAPKASSYDIAHHIMVRADKDRDQKLSLAEFLYAAESSTSMDQIVQGALNASSSPFTRRRVVAYNLKH